MATDTEKISHELHSLHNEHETIARYADEFDQMLFSIEESMTEGQIQMTEKFLDFVETVLLPHFEEEESEFFPFLSRFHENYVDPLLAQAMVEQLIEEHTLIRSLYQRVRRIFANIDNEISLDWFVASAMSLVDFMRTHARKENAVILMLTQGLSGEEMQQEIYKAYSQVHHVPREFI